MLAAGVLALGSACRRGPKYEPYSPHDNVLSIGAEFLLASSLDPYRDPPGRDLTGQAIARSTLVRLANYEALHPGRLQPEVWTMKARALELLGDYESARRNSLDAAEFETELRADNRRRAQILERFLAALAPTSQYNDLESVLKDLSQRAETFRALARDVEEQPYRSLALREAEDAEVQRSELLIANRLLLPGGDEQALAALNALVDQHRESARALEHALRLAHFHRELAEAEARLNPPDRPGFSPERFKRHYDAALDLLHRISQADGRPERLVARQELDALLTWGETIQDRMK